MITAHIRHTDAVGALLRYGWDFSKSDLSIDKCPVYVDLPYPCNLWDAWGAFRLGGGKVDEVGIPIT